MGVKRLEDLVVFQLSSEFKREVYRIVQSSPTATADRRYKDQLFEAASGVEASIDEGWHRYVASEFAQFLRYARASLAEAKRRLRDGVDRGHFSDAQCRNACVLADRCNAAIMNLHKSLRPFFRRQGK